jgi:hypothetical protein
MTNKAWIEHAYPLKQVFIQLQGTRQSSREEVVELLETVVAKLKAGHTTGGDNDDDFGYFFEYRDDVPGPSLFDEEDPGDIPADSVNT